jgi:hypothetical protein
MNSSKKRGCPGASPADHGTADNWLCCQEYAYVIGASVKTLIKGAGVLPHHHYHYNYYLEHIIKNLLNTISLASIWDTILLRVAIILTSATARVLFRKVAKGLDEKDFVIAQQELRIKQLEAKVVQLEPRKRRKVQLSPNSKFASIRAIIRA